MRLLIQSILFYSWTVCGHPGAIDSIGCHIDEITGNYHCHQGELEGREFISKEIAEDALQAMKSQADADHVDELQVSTIKSGKQTEESDGEPDLRLMSWSARQFGKEGFDYDRAAIVSGESDLLVLQDLRFALGGTDPLQILAEVMKQRYGRDYCKAWLKMPSGLRHGFLWRDDHLGYVNAKGEIRESCDGGVIRFEPKKDVATATFLTKKQKRMFTVVSLFSEKKPKNFDREVFPAFKSVSNQAWPVFVVGNFQTGTSDKVLKKVKEARFVAAVQRAGKGAKDNVWFKDAGLISASASHSFSGSQAQAVDDPLPVRGSFSFTVAAASEAEPSVHTLKNAKKTEPAGAKAKTSKARTKTKAKAKKKHVAETQAKPPLVEKENYEVYTEGESKPMDTREDLHEELNAADKAVDE